jgi:hypothetical protein
MINYAELSRMERLWIHHAIAPTHSRLFAFRGLEYQLGLNGGCRLPIVYQLSVLRWEVKTWEEKG